MFSRIIKLIMNYNTLKNLKWTKKGIYFYISYLIIIIQAIVSHPIFRIIKYSFNLILIFYIAYITYLYGSLEVYNIENINNSLIELHKNVIKYIRDELNYLLNEEIVTLKEDSNLKSIETEISSDKSNISSNNTTSNNTTSNNTTDMLWFSFITIVVVSIIVIYHYPDILSYFKDIDNDSDLLHSPNPDSPTESDYFKELNELTPKMSSSNLQTSENSISNKIE